MAANQVHQRSQPHVVLYRWHNDLYRRTDGGSNKAGCIEHHRAAMICEIAIISADHVAYN